MAHLELTGVAKRFGQLQALASVDLAVEPKQIHGLIGPNGSGKSTLMKCIAGALIPDTGAIRFAGRDITTASPAARARAGLSIKFQITSVLPTLSVYDNILLALQAHASLGVLLRSASRRALHERVFEALDRVALIDRADDLAGVLSHGEQQWLEIAMAVASGPTLVLLDEPTAGMSLEERRVTGELLAPLRQHCSILIVSTTSTSSGTCRTS
jgi:branched-chain amino acid transport system ATP-binding protein/urea transport system ATP-binding protein